MIVVGVDPGKTGGVALLNSEEPGMNCAWPLPYLQDGGKRGTATPHIAQWLYLLQQHLARYALGLKNISLVIVERQQVFKGQGLVSMQTLLRGYGEICGACKAMQWPFQEVAPQEWQTAVLALPKAVRAPRKKDAPKLTPAQKRKRKAERRRYSKAASISWASKRYPGVKLDINDKTLDGLADALCLAHYGLGTLLGWRNVVPPQESTV